MPSTVKEIIFFHTPSKVNINHLTSDLCLLEPEIADQTIAKIKKIRSSKKLPSTYRFKKTDLGISFDIIDAEEDYYAVYFGKKKNSHLGIGGFGYVKLVRNIKTREWAALKLTVIDEDKNEFKILEKIDLALGYIERELPRDKENSFIENQIIQHDNGHGTWWSPRQANLLMKLAEGISLADLAQADFDFPDSKWLEILIQDLRAYKILKDKDIIHKDIKLANLFYSLVGNKAELIDFGASHKKSFFDFAKKKLITYTKAYAAPEIANGQYSEASDIYAFGITFNFLLQLDNISSSRIKDPNLRNTLYNYCFTHMAAKHSNRRPSTEQAIQYFETLQHSLMNVVPKPFKKIAIFSLVDYLDAKKEDKPPEKLIETPNSLVKEGKKIEPTVLGLLSNLFNSSLTYLGSYFYPEQQPDSHETTSKSVETPISLHSPIEPKKKCDLASYTSALTCFDEVLFIDNTEETQKEYLILCRELEGKNIIVGQSCFVTDNDNLTELIPEILAKLKEKRPSDSHQYFYVTPQEELKLNTEVGLVRVDVNQTKKDYLKIINDHLDVLTKNHYQRIKNLLTPLTALNTDVQSTIDDFDKRFSEGKLSIDYIKQSLATLKEQPIPQQDQPTKSSTHSFPFFPKPSKEFRKAVKKLNDNIDSWVDSYTY